MEKQIESKQGNYTFKAIPLKNKSWENAEEIQIVFTLETENEIKSFKGIVSLFGIIKK